MKVDFTKPLMDFDGDTMKIQDEKSVDEAAVKPLLLKDVVRVALLNAKADNSEAAIWRFDMARTVHHAKGAIDVTSSDIVQIKELVAKSWPTMIVGTAFEMIEPRAK